MRQGERLNLSGSLHEISALSGSEERDVLAKCVFHPTSQEGRWVGS